MLGDVTSNKVKVNTKALEEIKRMKEFSPFQPCQLQTTALAVTMDSFFIIHCLNINSFLPNEKSFNKDCLTMSSHITCLNETWLRSKMRFQSQETTVNSGQTAINNTKMVDCYLIFITICIFWNTLKKKNGTQHSFTGTKTRSFTQDMCSAVVSQP